MRPLRLTTLAHDLIRQVLRPGDWAIDATVGNGHDTAMLAECVGPMGRVFGFDIQARAIEQTRRRLGEAAHVQLMLAGHEAMTAHLPPEARRHVRAIVFNLGYLPQADRAVTTRPATTIAALTQALDLIAAGGRVTVMAYRGHAAGVAEADAVRTLAAGCGDRFVVTLMARLGTVAPTPELSVFERLV